MNSSEQSQQVGYQAEHGPGRHFRLRCLSEVGVYEGRCSCCCTDYLKDHWSSLAPISGDQRACLPFLYMRLHVRARFAATSKYTLHG
jgi:hypothetical protein